jgi:hypothetical protein
MVSPSRPTTPGDGAAAAQKGAGTPKKPVAKPAAIAAGGKTIRTLSGGSSCDKK